MDNSIFHAADSLVETNLAIAHRWPTFHMWTEESDLLCSVGYVCFYVVALSHVMPNLDERQGNGGSKKENLQSKKQNLSSVPRPWLKCLKADQSTLLQQQDLRSLPTRDKLRRGGLSLAAHYAEYELLALALLGGHEASKSIKGRRIAGKSKEPFCFPFCGFLESFYFL
jgi:hypothetical protein